MASATIPPDNSPIYCRHCARRLATISPDGVVQAASHNPSQSQSQSETNANACTTAPSCACAPFDALYATLQEAEREHQGLLSKRPNHGGRVRAHDRLRAAKVAFGNLVLAVQMQGTGTLDATHFGDCEKRLLDEGTLPSRLGNGEGPNGSSLGDTQMALTQSVPQHSASLSHSRKRIQFTADVPDQQDYRGSDAYCRSHSEYAPGRYTPSEGCEYLDTSGSNQTFLKFTKQRRVKDRWVDVETQEEGENEQGAVASVGSGKRKKRASTEIETKDDAASDTAKDGAAVSSRELRLARRARGREQDNGAADVSAPRKRSRSRKKDTDSSSAGQASASSMQDTTRSGAPSEVVLTEAAPRMFQQTAQILNEAQGININPQITGSGRDEITAEVDRTKAADQQGNQEAQVGPARAHGVPTTPGETVDDQQNISAVRLDRLNREAQDEQDAAIQDSHPLIVSHATSPSNLSPDQQIPHTSQTPQPSTTTTPSSPSTQTLPSAANAAQDPGAPQLNDPTAATAS